MSSKILISDKRRYYEILAVVLTGFGKFVFMDGLNLRFIYITLACVFWTGYIFRRYKAQPDIFQYWGFRKDTFKRVMVMIAPFFITALIAFFIIGHFAQTNIISWHILPLLILYPVWGTIQQFLIVGLISGNLKSLKSKDLPNWVIVLITSIVFAGVHYPFKILIAGTFLLALVYSIVYLKVKNLYVLGIVHGWLGAFFFYTVLERDPFVEVFGFLI